MYNAVPSSPSGARISSCLCAPFRAFRFARPCLGRHPSRFSLDTAPGAVGSESWVLSASLCRAINSKRKRETTTILSWRPLHNRPAGGLLKVPRFVGNPATEIVSKVNLSTTLFQKTGVLRGGTPKLIFAYFCSVTKVGPRRVGGPHLRQALPNPAYIHGKRLVPGDTNSPRARSGWHSSRNAPANLNRPASPPARISAQK